MQINELLFQAAINGNIEATKSLLSQGAVVNSIHKLGDVEVASLYMAAQNGHVEVVNLLLNNGAEVDAKLNSNGATALYIASLNGHTEIVELLLNAGANKETEVAYRTPLYEAVYKRDAITVYALLKAGAKILLEGNRLSPLNIAAADNDKVKDLLFKHYWKIVENTGKELLSLENDRSFEVVVVRYNEDLSWIAREFPTEKVTIYNKGNDSLVLPANCQEVKTPNVGYLGGTYLYHIINNYDQLADRTLFIQGYPYDHPLKMPLIRNKFESDSGCKNIIAKCTSPQDFREENEQIKQIKFGKFNSENGVYEDFNLQNADIMGFTKKFIGDDLSEKVRMCIGAQFAVDADKILGRGIEVYQALYNAMNYTVFPMEDFYMERLWDVLFKEKDPIILALDAQNNQAVIDNLLFTASMNGKLVEVENLLTKGANVNVIRQLGDVLVKPLYMAAQNGHVEVVKLLLDNGAEVDAKLNTNGATALYIASLNGHTEIVDLLLSASANTEVAVAYQTPLYISIYKRDVATSNILLKAGAKVILEGNLTSPINVAAAKNDDVKDLVLKHYWDNLQGLENNIYAASSDNSLSFEVVVARFNEDLSWIAKELPNERVIVYNKGEDDLDLSPNCQVIKLANIGTEAHTYLYHISHNYNQLADRTLFVQGQPYDHPLLLPLIRNKWEINSGCKNIIAICHSVPLVYGSDFIHDLWTGNKNKNYSVKSKTAIEFAHKFIGKDLTPETIVSATQGAEFTVSKNIILRHKAEYYKAILDELDSRYPVEGYYIEFLWDMIFRKEELEEMRVASFKSELISSLKRKEFMTNIQHKISGNINEYCPPMEIVNNIRIVKDINDNLMALSPSDQVVSKSLLQDGVWEEGINYLLDKIVKKGDIVLNLGTHIGFHTLHMSKLVGDTGQIYSFEANPFTYKILLTNLFLNNASNVITYNNAAYSENTQVNFVGLNSNGLNLGASHVTLNSNSQEDPYAEKADFLMVNAVKIDDVLSNIAKVNFIQMDIEGCEPKAMYGAINLISRSENLMILQEWIPNQMSAQSNVKEYIEFLRSLGYEIAAIPQMGSRFILEKITDQQLLIFNGDVLIAKNISLINENLVDEPFLSFNYCPSYIYEYLLRPAFYDANNIEEFLTNQSVNIETMLSGATALYYMSQNGHQNAVKHLLNVGANTETKAVNGLTPLYIAVQNQHVEIVKMLLEAGANTETSLPSGSTPLYLAAYYGYDDLVELLLQYNASKNIIINGKVISQLLIKNPSTPHIFSQSGVDEVALITMIKNEEDIIFENLAWHFTTGFRKFVIIDNLSTDNTKQVIQSFIKLTENHAKVFLIEDPIFEHIQSQIITGSYDFVRSVWPQVKWIFPVDADEFWITKQPLKDVLINIPSDVDAISVIGEKYYASSDYCTFDKDSKFYEKLHYRTHNVPQNYKTWLAKIAVKSKDNINIEQGNHNIHRTGDCNSDNIKYISGDVVGLDMYEFPIRSPKQVHKKYFNGALANLQGKELGVLPAEVGGHWDSYINYIRQYGEKAGEVKFNESFIDLKDSVDEALPIGEAIKILYDIVG